MNMNNQEFNLTEQEKLLLASLRSEGLTLEEKRIIKATLHKQFPPSKRFFGTGFIMPSAFFTQPAFGALVFLILAFAGIGVGKASEKSLPGETLYIAKTVFYEPVSNIFSDESSLELAKEQITKRLREADALIREGRFGDAEKRQLETLINTEVAVLRQQEQIFSESLLQDEFGNISQRVQLVFSANGETELRVIPAVQAPSSWRRSVNDEQEKDDQEDDHSSQEATAKQEGADKQKKESVSGRNEHDDSRESSDNDTDETDEDNSDSDDDEVESEDNEDDDDADESDETDEDNSDSDD